MNDVPKVGFQSLLWTKPRDVALAASIDSGDAINCAVAQPVGAHGAKMWIKAVLMIGLPVPTPTQLFS